MTAQQTFRNTLVVILTLAGAYALFMGIRILIVLLVAIIMASAVRPAVLWFTRRRAPQGLAILLVYFLLAMSIFSLAVLVLPPAANQLAGYIENEDRLASRMITAQNWVAQQVELRTGSQIQTLDPTAIHETIATTVAQIRESIPALAGQFGGLLGDFVLVFIIGVYWLTSRDQAIAFILSLFSIGRRALINQIITEIETGLGNYTRGVVMVSVFVGIANFIIMSLLGVPNAVTLAFIVGVTTALPLVGGIIGAAAATLIAVLSSPLHALMTLGSIVAVQQVEAHYLTPRVMSRSVGLNPILIIVILFIGFAVGGVVGGLIAVPVAGTVMVLLRYLVIEPRKEVAAPQRTEGGILITTRDGRADAPPPVTVGTVVQPTTPPPVQTKPGT